MDVSRGPKGVTERRTKHADTLCMISIYIYIYIYTH